MARVVRAFPILPDKAEVLTAFLAELTARKDETARFYGKYGVTRESAHVQVTAHGALLIVCTDLSDAEHAAAAYAAETAAFEAWFKGKVLEVTGIDPNRQPLGPETSCVFDWQG